MIPADLETLLREWGRAYGARPPREWEEDRTLTGSHPIASAMEYAHRGDGRQVSVAWRRPRNRQPFADPIVCTETRASGSLSLSSGSGAGAKFTPEVERVQSGVIRLRRIAPIRAACLQAEYCSRGRQFDKAEQVTQQTGERVLVRRYRSELDTARVWMGAWLASRDC